MKPIGQRPEGFGRGCLYGLFGLDANSSSSSLTQAQVTSQYGQAIGANIGKGSASGNASGTVTIGGGVNIKKGGTLTIDNTNTQLENSILEGLTNIQSALSGGTAAGGDSGGSSGGIGGLFGGSSNKGGKTGASGSGGGVTGGNISLGSGNSGAPDLISELQGNQANNANPSTDLLDQLNASGSSDISDVSHPHVGGLVFSPNSGGNSTNQGSGNGISFMTIVIGVVVIIAGGYALKKLKLN